MFDFGQFLAVALGSRSPSIDHLAFKKRLGGLYNVHLDRKSLSRGGR